METLGKRISKFIDLQGLNKFEFCKKFNLNYDSILPISTDKRAIGINILNKFKEIFPNLNAEWLLYGNGQMILDEYAIDSVNETAEIYGEDSVENVFLEYLAKNSIKKQLKKVVREVLNEKDQEIYKDVKADELVLKFTINDSNSELVARLEELIKSDITSHKLPKKK